MEANNDTLENCIRAKSIVLEETLSDLEKQIEDSNDKTLEDENIKTLERRIYVLTNGDFCEMEFKAGSEKDRKEKDAHVRATNFLMQYIASQLQVG